MLLSVWSLPSSLMGSDATPKEIVSHPDSVIYEPHEVSCVIGQDCKSRGIDDKSIRLMAIGIACSEDDETKLDDMWVAWEFNGKWGKL